MKPIMILLLILCWIGNAEAQEVTQLDEVKVTYDSEVSIVTNLNDVELKVKENYPGHFEKNPIRFMQENFDIDELLNVIETDDFEEIQVSFISRKGFLQANFDKDGELLKTYQQFKNIALPRDLIVQLYDENKGWSMVSNKYVARGKGNMIENEKYRIRLKNDGQKKNITIIPSISEGGRVASN